LIIQNFLQFLILTFTGQFLKNFLQSGYAFSDDEYELLKEDAYSEGWAVSSWARKLVMNLVWEYLEREKFKEAMRKAEEKEGC